LDVRQHRFQASETLRLPRGRVFPFFAEADNLESITPPELRFKILTPLPIEMREGALVRYQLRLFGVGFEWLTRITFWDPPHEFVDEQLKGPYHKWVHRHRFTEVPEGTRIDDDVLYELPLFPLGEVAAPLVAWQVRRIFAYRALAIRRALIPGSPARGQPANRRP
jgi:ligand-binding SRPBCC domain-containing protein